ncbi:hypothetical protein KUF57_26245 [Mycolicibacterium sp. PAM1]|uniref:hypothetical protein n=1 Tax=Mycolicibacterium sp. PAM1 TaxID=2853535 RepID=UPI001C3CD9B7|nr:hypothetical protein [Mycolicibacterium sp. PAM1]MBV5247031.1 hypothetical protein [Mycolicibacterium sp. PAM1]
MAGSVAIRLDPKLYQHHQRVRQAVSSLKNPLRLGSIADFSNGLNLPKSAYADPADEVVGLYLSVRGLANYAFTSQLCNPLRSMSKTEFLEDPNGRSDLTVKKSEVLITRSRASAPGLAMSGSEVDNAEIVVPSGFVIRANVGAFDPTFITAIMNHPVWRSYTAGLAAGKSQDNLSHDLLEYVPIPDASRRAQESVADTYREFLRFAVQVAAEDEKFAAACDQIVGDVLGLELRALPPARVRHRAVPLSEVAEARTVRLDNRWHGAEFRSVILTLLEVPTRPLGELLVENMAKGRQPNLVLEGEEGDNGQAAATSSLRFGVVSEELLKRTTADCVAAFSVLRGDLLVAMDGDGSVGKCAVYGGAEPITADSHLARLRVGYDDRAAALSCWLNSTWGQAQTNGMMSGATGQTQLSPDDLLSVRVPNSLLEHERELAKRFQSLTAAYVPAHHKVRAQLCETSAAIAALLLADGALIPTRGKDDPWSLKENVRLMKRIYPSVR